IKKNIISIFSILLLLLVNTSYFWENLPGLFDVVIVSLIFLGFVILLLIFINQLIKGFTEKLKSKIRRVNLFFSLTVLLLIYLFPRGFINFEKIIHGDDIFYAQYEGVANGTVTLKFK